MWHRGPGARRNFLNTALISSSQYLAGVVQYQRALRQRNAALKTSTSRASIDAWTELLAQHAGVVWSLRQTFTKYLQTRLSELYRELFGEHHEFTVELVPGAADPDKYLELLGEAWPYEQKYRYTLYGPHRDDIRVLANGRPVAAALSRGQIRSLVIAMKLATHSFVRKITKQEPLVLFDEVLSELDEKRQLSLLQHLPAAQIILTCTALPGSIRERPGVQLLDLRRIIDSSETSNDSIGAPEHVKVTAEAQEEKVSVQA